LKKKKCKICRDSFEPVRQLQPTCENMTCMIEYSNRHLTRKAKVKKQVARKALKQFNNSDINILKRLAQKLFNQFIRLRDEGLNCISCQKPYDGAFDCGHFKPRGGYSALAFNEDNCSGQCKKCNRFLSANLVDYRKNLIIKIGLERVEYLETCTQTKKWTVEELREIKETYKRKTKELLQNMV